MFGVDSDDTRAAYEKWKEGKAALIELWPKKEDLDPDKLADKIIDSMTTQEG